MDLLVESNAMDSKSCEKRKEIKNEEKTITIGGLQKKLKLHAKVDLAYLVIHLMQGQ